jgi:hypothetical protein
MILRIAIIGFAALIGTVLAEPARAADDSRAAVQNRNTDISAQQRRRSRVYIYRDYQPPFWDYPRPGTYSWPGPNAKRDCRAWYVLENRPSGAVMTPRQQCWWVPG